LAFGLATIARGIASLIGGQLTDKFGIPSVLTAVSFIALIMAIGLIASKGAKKRGVSEHKLHHWKFAVSQKLHK
jgi:MFS family permease